MVTAYLDYMKERESVEAGPFVFTRFETNPVEQPDCLLCYSSLAGNYIAGIANEFEWERDPDAASTHLVVLTNAGGSVILLAGFKEGEQAAATMRKAREVGAGSGAVPAADDSRRGQQG